MRTAHRTSAVTEPDSAISRLRLLPSTRDRHGSPAPFDQGNDPDYRITEPELRVTLRLLDKCRPYLGLEPGFAEHVETLRAKLRRPPHDIGPAPTWVAPADWSAATAQDLSDRMHGDR